MLLQLSGISLHYATTPILQNIHLQVQEQDRIGLVGVNGAGKSTLLKIIAGELTPDEGELYKAKETKIGYLAQTGGLDSGNDIWHEMLDVYRPLLSLEEQMRSLESQMADPSIMKDDKRSAALMERYAKMSDLFREQGGYEIEANIRGVLHGMGFADIPRNTPIRTLSGGQKTRLALAKLLLQSPDLLMLDEPTNYLDIVTLTWLESYLKTYSGAIIVVSHDRYFLDAIVHTIVEIERTEAKRYTGNYSKFIELKAHQYEIEMKAYEKQQDTMARMEDFVRKNIARASTTRRAQSRRKALERMEKLDKPLGETRKASFRFEIERLTGKDVLKVKGVTKSYVADTDDSSRKVLFRDIGFQLNRGDFTALIGPNGIGKSTLLKIILGKIKADEGEITWGSNVNIGYYDQEQESLNNNNTVLEELWNAYPHMEEVQIRTVLGNFLFSGEDVLKKIGSLSGGEKSRVALAKLMLQQANVLLLDEPTNHLDLYSKEILESALQQYEGTILFISHDRYFLNKMADSILELSANGVQYFLGNYDDYVEKKAALTSEEQLIPVIPALSSSAPNRGSSMYESEKQARREERMRERRIEQLEQDITRLEQLIADIEADMARPDVYQNYVLVQEKSESLEQARKELQACYEEWESLLS